MSILLRNIPKLSNQIRYFSASQANCAKVVNVFGRRSVDTEKSDESEQSLGKIPEKAEDVSALSGVPEEHIKERVARIYVPSKNAMQSGTFATNRWRVQLDTRERWENPLMGWGSSGDPLSSMQLDFTNKEDAIIYCERMGYKYELEDKKEVNLRPKTYGNNFSWNKRTRRTAK